MRGYGEFGEKKEIVQFLSDFRMNATKLFERTSGTHVYVQKKISFTRLGGGEAPVKDLLKKYNNFIGEAPPT